MFNARVGSPTDSTPIPDQPAGRWPAYYQAVAGAAPHPTLLAALEQFGREASGHAPRLAVDLGCGSGRDTLELLRRGWRVVAIDAEPHAIELLLQRADPLDRDRLEARVGRLEDTAWPAADLVNASAVLPFLSSEAFAAVWIASGAPSVPARASPATCSATVTAGRHCR